MQYCQHTSVDSAIIPIPTLNTLIEAKIKLAVVLSMQQSSCVSLVEYEGGAHQPDYSVGSQSAIQQTFLLIWISHH